MDIQRIRRLHAPNVWARVPVLEAWVDCRAGQSLTPDVLAAFFRRLATWLPRVANRPLAVQARTAVDAPPTVRLAQMLGAVALELQSLSRTVVGFGATADTAEPGLCLVVVECEEEKLGRACLESACRFSAAAVNGEDLDVAGELRRLDELAEDVCLGRVTRPLAAAARARGIPVRRLDDVSSLVQLGHGARQHRIQAAVTDRTGRIADGLSTDKDLTKKLLRELGLPVPLGRTVTGVEEAWAAACEVGLPVTVKPRDADYGNGVSLNLTTREEVLAAFACAREFRQEVIIERFARGEQHRVIVVGDRVVAANRREPPRVVGDGQRTITELIAEENLDPRRGGENDKDRPWWYIHPDDDTPQVLSEQGLDLQSVPPPGVTVVLSRLGHISAGAWVSDVTDAVHPLTAAQCVSAVRLIGLDVAGLDIIAQDISRPLEEQGGVILEVNSEPSIIFHFPPLCETYRPVCEAIIESLFPAGETGHIPLAAVTGSEAQNISRELAQLLRGGGRRVGCASSAGLYLGDRRLKPGNQANLAGCRALLLCPEVEWGVCELPLQSIREEGLGFDRCQVAVISRLSDQDRTAEQLRAARLLVDALGTDGVLVVATDDPAVLALAADARCAVTRVGAAVDRLAVMAGHAQPTRTVHLRGNEAILTTADRTGSNRSMALLSRAAGDFHGEHGTRTALESHATITADGTEQRLAVPSRLAPGAQRSELDDWLAAVAAASALGLPLETSPA